MAERVCLTLLCAGLCAAAPAHAGPGPFDLLVETDPENPPPPPGEAALALTYPGRPWTLRLELPGFRHGEPRREADGARVRLRGFHEDSGLTLDLTLGPAEPGETPSRLRERTWRRVRRRSADPPRRGDDLDRGDGVVLTYTRREVRGVPVGQRHVHLLLVHDGVAIDVHLSQPQYDARRDAERFERLLDSVRVEPQGVSGSTGRRGNASSRSASQ